MPPSPSEKNVNEAIKVQRPSEDERHERHERECDAISEFKLKRGASEPKRDRAYGDSEGEDNAKHSEFKQESHERSDA